MLVNRTCHRRLTRQRIGAISQLGHAAALPSTVARQPVLRSTRTSGGTCSSDWRRARSGQSDRRSRTGSGDRQSYASGLRGQGGAGSRPGKVVGVHPAPGAALDRATPTGRARTFRDHELLTHHADLVFQCMTVTGLATGATRGVVTRGYPFLIPPLLTGQPRPPRNAGLSDSLRHRTSHRRGAYVYGRVGAAHGRWRVEAWDPVIPNPVNHRPSGQPTVVDNVETLSVAVRSSPSTA